VGGRLALRAEEYTREKERGNGSFSFFPIERSDKKLRGKDTYGKGYRRHGQIRLGKERKKEVWSRNRGGILFGSQREVWVDMRDGGILEKKNPGLRGERSDKPLSCPQSENRGHGTPDFGNCVGPETRQKGTVVRVWADPGGS